MKLKFHFSHPRSSLPMPFIVCLDLSSSRVVGRWPLHRPLHMHARERLSAHRREVGTRELACMIHGGQRRGALRRRRVARLAGIWWFLRRASTSAPLLQGLLLPTPPADSHSHEESGHARNNATCYISPLYTTSLVPSRRTCSVLLRLSTQVTGRSLLVPPCDQIVIGGPPHPRIQWRRRRRVASSVVVMRECI